MPIEILKETPHWIAVNKPNGLNVEQLWDFPSVETQVKEYLKDQHNQAPFLGIVHRLDRPVSGVLLLAKRKQPLKRLNEQFANKTIQKTYWAVTESIPENEEGTIEHYLLKDQKLKRAFAYSQAKPKSVKSSLSYKVIQQKDQLCLLEIRPHSGKFHQIRVQLSAIGCPIVGDYKYGGQLKFMDNGIALHARELLFNDPKTDDLQKLSAPLPEHSIWDYFGSIK